MVPGRLDSVRQAGGLALGAHEAQQFSQRQRLADQIALNLLRTKLAQQLQLLEQSPAEDKDAVVVTTRKAWDTNVTDKRAGQQKLVKALQDTGIPVIVGTGAVNTASAVVANRSRNRATMASGVVGRPACSA